MIMHTQCDDSIWEKKQPSFKLMLSQNKQNDCCGTFKMNTDEN